ncbi:MAG: OmpP1/FadL family transporter [Thermodesulfobacteriota bacterium]
MRFGAGMGVCLVAVVCLLVFSSGQLFAAGFGIYEWSARGNALGGTLVGRADDASAVAYNPAGMTQLNGTQAMAGLSAIAPQVDVVTKNGGKSETTAGEDNIWLPPHAYLTTQLGERYWLGVGVFSRFGLGTEYSDSWPGRYNTTYAGIQSVSVNPNLGIKLTDDLSFAVGVEAMWFEFTQEKYIEGRRLGGSDFKAKLKGDSVGYGFNAAVHYAPVDWLKMGVVYRSEVSQSVEGNADFAVSKQPATVKAYFPDDCGAHGDITLPDSWTLGIVVRPLDNLSIEADAVRTGWSSYNELKMHYDKPVRGSKISSTPKDWNDTWRLQFGVEYSVNDMWDLRASYIYDESPIPDKTVDYMVPANDRQLYGVGTGLHWDSWTVDLSYTYLTIKDRDVDARPGDYIYEGEFKNGYSHIAGLSVGYKF